MKFNITVCYPGDRVFAFEIENSSESEVKSILSVVFSGCNYDSGCEFEEFKQQNCRSMSVGDLVAVNGQWFICRPVSWESITAEQFNSIIHRVETFIKENPENTAFWYSSEIGYGDFTNI